MSEESIAATLEPEAPAPDASEPSPQDTGSQSPDSGTGSAGAQHADATSLEQPGPSGESPSPTGTDPSPSGSQTPNTDRTPFAFRVDRAEFSGSGDSFVTADGVRHIAAKDWESIVQPRLVDRGAFHRREQDLRGQVEHFRTLADPEHNPEVLQSREFNKLFKDFVLNPEITDEQFAELRWQWQQQRPVYEANANASAAQARLQRYETAEQQQSAEQFITAIVPNLKQGVEQYVQSALQHQQFAGLDLDANEILELLLPNGGTREELDGLWGEAAQPDALSLQFGIPQKDGQQRPFYARLNHGEIDRVLTAQAMAARRTMTAAEKRIAAIQSSTSQAAQVAKENAAVLNPPASKPVVSAQGSGGGIASDRPWKDLERQAAEERRKGNFGKADELMEEAKALNRKARGGF